ncbi:MAG TPA: hypothetical protein VFG04_16295 [Planctomycetaceae bacterium]|nr:hypothetical protein [Planctomycetaceae bacterium]
MSETYRSGFVAKATSAAGLEMWISPPRPANQRVFGPRENAEVFRTRGQAQSAIGQMPQAFHGFKFTVEETE